MSGRQGFPDALRVRRIDLGNHGGAEHEASRMGRGQFEDAAHGLLRPLRRDRAACGRRVFFERRLYIHGEMRVGRRKKDLLHHIRPHAVGVHLDRRTVACKLLRELRDSRSERGLAAGYDQTVQPGRPGLEKGPYVRLANDGKAFGVPGEPGVVAMGAFEIAAAEKYDGRDPARPVAQRKGLKPPDDIPC